MSLRLLKPLKSHNMLWQLYAQTPQGGGAIFQNLKMAQPLLKRLTHADGTRKMIGEREVVGYGVNGCPIYIDCVEFPFPAIRFREPSSEICALREKEHDDWNNLSLEDKKTLYRYSFCQTYAEFQYFVPGWKLALGIGLWACTIGFLVSVAYQLWLYGPLPDTFDEERRQAQLRRMIALEVNPITGLSSKWCYEKNAWK